MKSYDTCVLNKIFMSDLFENFNAYIDSFCVKLKAEVEETFIHQEDTNGKVYVCAISRKTPKLLDLLRDRRGDLDVLWDKLAIITEIAIPFIDWHEIKKIILIDDAIYFGSTFTAIYRQLLQYAPHVKIVPMCCIRASEVNLDFDNELCTTIVPRHTGHYFVNCLSIEFRKQCAPFEVEFPVFRISLPEKAREKASLLYTKLLENQWLVYEIDNHIGCYSDESRAWVKYTELGIDLSEDGAACQKLRLYVKDNELLISSICTYPILQDELMDNQIFQDTPYEKAWNLIKENIHLLEIVDDASRQSLCVSINFLVSIAVFDRKWLRLRNSIHETYGVEFSIMQVELRIRELTLLFGEVLADELSSWYHNNFSYAHEVNLSKPSFAKVEQIDITKEYLPKNLPYRNYYRELQDGILQKFDNPTGVLMGVFYLQNFMLDKRNRIFYAVNNERLKYGHTFGSLAYLLQKVNMMERKYKVEMHSWVDAQIDSATIVPQYIKVRTQKNEDAWIRTFRSGENELHFISHWARLSVVILRKEKELIGSQRFDVAFFDGLLSYIYNKFILSQYFLDDAECYYSKERYSIRVHVGSELINVLDLLEKLEVVNIDKINGLVELNETLLDADLMKGSVLPDEVMDDIEDELESLGRVIPELDSYLYYIPYFDAKLGTETKAKSEGLVYNEEDLLKKVFILFEKISKNDFGDAERSKTQFAIESKSLLILFLARYTRRKEWHLENMYKNDRMLREVIQITIRNLQKKGFWRLIKLVRLAYSDKEGNRLRSYVKQLSDPNFDFLQSFIFGSTTSGLKVADLLQHIIQKKYQIWMF